MVTSRDTDLTGLCHPPQEGAGPGKADTQTDSAGLRCFTVRQGHSPPTHSAGLKVIPEVAGVRLDQSAVVDEGLREHGAWAEVPAGCQGLGGILRGGVSSTGKCL